MRKSFTYGHIYIDIYAMKLFWKIVHSLVYMYYTHSAYQTSIFGKNCAYYIQIFMVISFTHNVNC